MRLIGLLANVSTLISLAVTLSVSTSSAEQGMFPDFSDEHTVALWLFDEPQYLRMTLTDASDNFFDLRLLDSGRLVPGRFGNALRVSANAGPAVAYPSQSRAYDERGFNTPDAWIVKPPARLLETFDRKEWTVEFWIKPEQLSETGATVFSLGFPDKPAFACHLGAGGATFVLKGESLGRSLSFPIDADAMADDRWHHVAFVRSDEGQAFKCYLDGQDVGASPSAQQPAAMATRELEPGLIGVVFKNQVLSPLGLEDAASVKAAGQVDFYWGEARDMSWREHWRGVVESPVDGEVEFWIEAHDGANLRIGDKVVIDGWENPKERSGRIAMRKGEAYPFRLEFRQMGATRQCRLHWRLPGADWTLAPADAFKHRPQDQSDAIAESRNVGRGLFHLGLGSGWLYDRPMQGLIDEVRISDIARYDGDFAAATLSRNHGPNAPAKTVANGLPLLFDGDRGVDPVALGSRKHVFIDDVMIAARFQARLKMNPPQMDQPTDMRNDRPWENNTPCSFGDSCFYDEDGTIRFMYSHSTMWRGNEEDSVYCMATSKDGLHFEKPEFNHIEWEGAPSNNIVLRRPIQGRFFKDPNPNAPTAERYKFGAFNMHRGVYLFTSPDGIHWRRNETILAPFDVGGGVEPYWDDQRGSYVAFIRNEGWTDWHEPFGRAVARIETTEPFKPWPFQPVAQPSILTKAWSLPSITTELPTAFAPRQQWNARPSIFCRVGQVYRSRAIKYAYAPDTYVAFHWRLYGIPDNEQRQTELAVSRDGINWTVYDDPYLPYGVEYEGAKVIEGLSIDGLVRRGDELWQYAELGFTYHGGRGPSGNASQNVMMRYKQRLDGFVALEAGDRTGWALTRPFTFEGEQLELNVAAKGRVRVAILDERETVLPGFSAAECDPIRADSVRHVVTWGGDSDVSRLAGRPVRLRLEMKNAKLYAFQFVKERS